MSSQPNASQDRVLATYLIETPHSLEHAAAVIAGEQSSGTFVSVPGETSELKERFGAQVVRIDALDSVSAPSLPGSKAPRSNAGRIVYQRGRIVIAFPLHNFGPSLPSLLGTVAGNLYELQELSGIRLEDLELPQAFAQRYPGPGFGIDGTRKLAQVSGRPLIGTIVKPSIGLSTEALCKLVRDLASAGLDFIKDDELQADPPYAPLAQRIAAVMREIERVADATGMTVSIGGGTSKLVAKLAVERAKPKPGTGANGVHIVAPGAELEFMRQLALADIPGIGPKTTMRLADTGLRTVEDVLALDAAALSRMVGERDAAWLAERVRGVDEGEVADRDVAKSISRDETFDTDLHDDTLLEGELAELVGRAAADLRGDELSARTVTVRIRDADFTTRQASRTVEQALSSDRALFAVARQLLAKLRRARRVPARLLGVALSNFTDPPPVQLALFEKTAAPLETARDRELSRAVDAVRARFGRDAIAPGRKPRR